MKVHEDVYVALIPTLPVAVLPNNQWYRRWVWSGCKRTPKSFDLVKIRAKSLKIREKSVESWAKCVKTFAMMCTDFLKWRPKSKCRLLNFLKAIFFNFFRASSGTFGKNRAWCALIWKKWAENEMKCSHFFGGNSFGVFFGQVWGNLGKNPSHPKKFACFYT